MTPSLRSASLLLVLLLAGGCAPLAKTDLTRLVTSGRDGYQHPDRVIASLGIGPGDRVAEIGAGDGYWIPWLSRAVGPDGIVYAVEVEDEKVAALEARAEREGLVNVVTIRGEYTDPRLPDGGIDLAMTSNTYHHIEGQVAYFRRLQADLAPGGRVAHIEDRHDVPAPLRWLQSSGHWSDPDELDREMREAGYARTASYDFLPVQSFQVYAPVGAAASR